MDFLIFRPISKASFSVNLDLAAIALRTANCEIRSLIASRATSDQLINLDFSISCFKSDGTDKVIVGIFYSPKLFILFKLFNTLNIFKSFGFVFDDFCFDLSQNWRKRKMISKIQAQLYFFHIGGGEALFSNLSEFIRLKKQNGKFCMFPSLEFEKEVLP
jgi:hypothetical protein